MIILSGYMGSGKSYIGKILAEKLNIDFLDLDELIEKRENCTIKSIFSTKGEIYFRRLEHDIFKELVKTNKSCVLSLGGGTPCYANNHELLQNNKVFSVYLKASTTTLVNRLEKEKEKRPLIAHLDHLSLEEFIAKHLFDRNYYYHQCKLILSVDNKTASEIVNEIIDAYAKQA